MRSVMLLLACLVLAGCGSPPGDRGSDGTSQAPDRVGVVIHNEPFTVAAGQPATFAVTIEQGARNVKLEIQQDSGVLPNLHVELTGCGSVDPPASAGWQAYPLCDVPAAGAQTLRITVGAGSPAGTGRALLRADLVS